jgi:Holliday junction resolvase
VESDLRDRVRESRQRLQRELDRVLRQVGQAAVRAAERGRATRAAGEDAVRGARARLERWLVALRDLTRR